MPAPKCCWLLSMPGVFPASYCGKPVGWHMVRDDDRNMVRKYESLCAEHKAKADQQESDDDA